MKRKLFVGVLILSLLLNAIFISRKLYYYFFYEPKPALNSNTGAGLFKEIYKYSPDIDNEIIFLGNSITAAFQIAEFLPGYNIRNRGISGNTTNDILNRIDDIAGIKPVKVFIMMGINDIVENVPVKNLLDNYSQIIEKIKNQSPETKIFIQSILPVSKSASVFFSGDENKINQMIDEVNQKLIQMAKERNLVYIDLNDVFKSKGELKDEYSWDGIHINARGYERWFEHIKPYIVIKEQQ